MDAYAKSKTPKEDRDKRSTPRWAYRAIIEELNVMPMWDVCAEEHTAVTPGRFWSADDDALTIDWFIEMKLKSKEAVPVVWMNPPYSDPEAWCKKAAQEALNGIIVIGLLPDDRSTKWYKRIVHGIATAVYLPPDRIPFVMPETGIEQPGNPRGSIIPVWTPWRTGITTESYIGLDIWLKHKPIRRARAK